MEMPFCDVIGCGAHAQWFLVTEREGALEEMNLCQRHWRQLMADRSRRVIRWSRATQLPAAGTPSSPPPDH
jgi:hypothetical protein